MARPLGYINRKNPNTERGAGDKTPFAYPDTTSFASIKAFIDKTLNNGKSAKWFKAVVRLFANEDSIDDSTGSMRRLVIHQTLGVPHNRPAKGEAGAVDYQELSFTIRKMRAVGLINLTAPKSGYEFNYTLWNEYCMAVGSDARGAKNSFNE